MGMIEGDEDLYDAVADLRKSREPPPLPKSVRVAYTDFKVEAWHRVSANASNRWGECSVVERLLRVQVDDRAHWDVLCTLIHEINHAIYWAYEIQKEDEEERLVGTLATAWAQVYRDNQDLVTFIAFRPPSAP